MIHHPWLSIWCRPRETIRSIVSENPNRSLWLLATIYGFSALLNLAQSISLGEAVSLPLLLLLTLLFSPVWGYLVFSFWSWIVVWTGKLLKGSGEFKAVRAAYAWSCVPLIVNIALWLLLTLFFGRQIFLSSPEIHFTQAQVTFLFLVLISKVVLAIWSLVIYLNALAEVQQFSILRAIGNILLAAILLTVALSVFWMVSVKFFGVGVPGLQILRETAFLKY